MMDLFENVDFRKAYVAHYPKMIRFAQEYVVSEADAENIVQDVFMELWKKRAVLSMPVNLIAFLFTATKNRCINHLRHESLEKKALEKLHEEQKLAMKMKFDTLEAFHHDFISEQEIEDILNKAIETLPEKCRQVFYKSRVEGKKQKEIAAELEISINTVESHMRIAYKKLRAELKDYLPLLIFLFL